MFGEVEKKSTARIWVVVGSKDSTVVEVPQKAKSLNYGPYFLRGLRIVINSRSYMTIRCLEYVDTFTYFVLLKFST